MLIDPLRVYVLWAPSEPGAKEDAGYRLANSLHRQLDVVGMIRDGIGFRIPVFHRSRRWRPNPEPRPIDLAGARRNVIIVVVDDVMRARPNWNAYLTGMTQQLATRNGADLILPVIVSSGDNLPALGMTQGIVANVPENAELAWESWLRRITMYAMGAIWAHERTLRLRQKGALPADAASQQKLRTIGVFLSHAKKDGEGAARLLERFQDLAPSKKKDKDKVFVNSVEMFFDAVSTVAGDDYDKQFKAAIENGALLGVITDAYHGRPWCMWEVLCAKECKSPILLWDLSHRGTLRSFPYLGNVPVVRTPDARYAKGTDTAGDELDVDSITDAEIERVLLALLSESMRMEVWAAHAESIVNESRGVGAKPIVSARPPELVDLARKSAQGATAVVYPDPPIGLYEQQLLADAFSLPLLPLAHVIAAQQGAELGAIQDSAASWTLAVSISESPDLEALGMFAADDKRLLGTLLTPLVYRGARIAYGGRIDPRSDTNFTQQIALQLAEAYRQVGPKYGSRPCIHYLRDDDARREGAEGVLQHALRLGPYSEIKLLRADKTVATLVPSGKKVDVQVDGDPVGTKETGEELIKLPAIAPVFAGPTGRDELADMRVAMALETSARIILGGRVTGVTNGIAGIAAEALATLEAGKPLLVVGAVGGASRDVAWKLGLIDDSVTRDDSVYLDNEDKPSKDRYWAHMEQLVGHAAAYKSSLDEHGLWEDARRLAASESHSEIESLVLKMLSKLLA